MRLLWDVGPGAEERFARAAAAWQERRERSRSVLTALGVGLAWLGIGSAVGVLLGKAIKLGQAGRPDVSTGPAPLLGVVQPLAQPRMPQL